MKARPSDDSLTPEERDLGERFRQIRDSHAFGEWFRDALGTLIGLDDEPWADDMVREIAARLNAVRSPAPPLEPVILWAAQIFACIGPGRYVYVARGLLHRAWWNDAVALILAHEMAHFDLGHTRIFDSPWQWARRLPGFFGAVLLLVCAGRWLNGPEREAAADARALDLCLAAGYDGRRCIEAFEVLEAYFLDHGDIDGVFGPATAPETRPGGVAGWLSGLHSWRWERRRGYPSIRSRKEVLLDRLRESAKLWSAPAPDSLPSQSVAVPGSRRTASENPT